MLAAAAAAAAAPGLAEIDPKGGGEGNLGVLANSPSRDLQ